MKRSNNEDSTLIVQYVGSEGDILSGGWLLAVADGMGGHQKGEIASSLALRILAGYVTSNILSRSSGGVENYVGTLEEAFSEANKAVYEKGMKSSPGMGTTLVAALVDGFELYVCSVGDSRCYLLADEGISRITKDDSVVQELVDTGKITRKQAMSHPRRNEITNAIGIFPPEEFQVSAFHVGSILTFDYILLSSDGLHGVLSDEEIAETVYSHDSVAVASGTLVDLANEKGGPDNISIVLGQVLREEFG